MREGQTCFYSTSSSGMLCYVLVEHHNYEIYYNTPNTNYTMITLLIQQDVIVVNRSAPLASTKPS